MDKLSKNDSENTFRLSKERILRIIKSNKEQIYVPIPVGINLSNYNCLYCDNDEIILESSEKLESDFFQKVKLPIKPEPSAINYRYKDNEYYISLVYNTIDLQKVLEILHQEHYILNLPVGIPIVIKNIKNHKDSVCGVIYFSRLSYGNPGGRIRYFERNPLLKKEKPREYANKHIGFIDRIAIYKDHQGIGLGTNCLKNLNTFLSKVFINSQLTHIEVMTSWSLEEFKSRSWAKEIKDLDEVTFLEDDDLFCRAGFERIDEGGQNKRKAERQDKGKKDRMLRKYRDHQGLISIRRETVIRYYYITAVNHERNQ